MDSEMELRRRMYALDGPAGELEQVKKALRLEKLLSPQLDQKRQQEIVDDFVEDFDDQKKEIGKLRKKMKDGVISLKDAWIGFATIDNDCRQLFKKSLTFVQGTLVRKEDIDGGVCQLADKLLHDLSTYAKIPWNGFTILDIGEYQLEHTEIIKMRFPDISIWSLPLAAHEFGHFLGPKLNDEKEGIFPYKVEFDKKGNDEERNHFQEYFADIFATMSLGPAFACSVILLRFSPATASVDQSTHPNDSKRVRAILWVLEKMGDPDKFHNQNYYNDIINFLRTYWNQGLEKTGQEEFKGVKWKKLEPNLNEIYEMINQYTYKDLPYKNVDWLRSKAFSFKFKQDDYQPEFENPPNLTRRDVLNAAWYCHLFAEKEKSAKRIAEQAIDVFNNID